MEEHLVLLALGSNLGDGPDNLSRAIRAIREHVGQTLAVSRFIESEPWGFDSPHRFTNGVIAVSTRLSPMELLDITQEIERDLGRKEKHRIGEAYQDRIIDIDILTYDHLCIENERLTLPHPHMLERDFVTIPMNDVLQQLRRSDSAYEHT